ncbi:MAG: pitrilysin family protein [Syntrophales bacterium]|nr:pitrilysin family protein [Syntrophales bacterium]
MYNKTILDSGIRVISEEIEHVRSISIGIWVECGSRYEEETNNGTAHFIEHMLFKGTQRRSAFDIAAAIDSVGGVMNAFTSKELTSFYIKIPDYHLPLSIDLLADIFQNSQFDKGEIEKEKSVVFQEIRMLEDSPDDYIHDFFEAQFWNGHRLGLPILGVKEGVEQFDRDGLLRFVNDHYGGRNIVITAAGHLKHEEFLALVRKSFGSVGGNALKGTDTALDIVPKVAVIEKDLEQIHMMIGTLAPSAVSERRYASFLLNAILGGSMSSRLFQEIREKRGLAYAIHSYLTPYSDTGMLNIYVGTGSGEIREVTGLIMDELIRMTTDILTADELHGAKELIKGNYLLSMESTDTRMTRLAKNEICFGRPIPSEEVVAGIDAVTSEEVRSLAQEIFNPGMMSVVAIGPISEKDLTLNILKG